MIPEGAEVSGRIAADSGAGRVEPRPGAAEQRPNDGSARPSDVEVDQQPTVLPFPFIRSSPRDGKEHESILVAYESRLPTARAAPWFLTLLPELVEHLVRSRNLSRDGIRLG